MTPEPGRHQQPAVVMLVGIQQPGRVLLMDGFDQLRGGTGPFPIRGFWNGSHGSAAVNQIPDGFASRSRNGIDEGLPDSQALPVELVVQPAQGSELVAQGC